MAFSGGFWVFRLVTNSNKPVTLPVNLEAIGVFYYDNHKKTYKFIKKLLTFKKMWL